MYNKKETRKHPKLKKNKNKNVYTTVTKCSYPPRSVEMPRLTRSKLIKSLYTHSAGLQSLYAIKVKPDPLSHLLTHYHGRPPPPLRR